MSVDYNKTLNLPKNTLDMRANLPAREPEAFKKADKQRIYYKIISQNEEKPLYILHDGPPYANGDIHLGTALNKILKDFIVKHKNMSGYCAKYVPGWDTHGLPTELKAMKSVGIGKNNNTLNPSEIRKICREYALQCVDVQKEQFKSLGVQGDFDDPYITLIPEYEAEQIKIFGEMMKKGYIYKGLKPVYWCSECTTALAEAEIEYEQDPCFSIYVKFEVADDKGIFAPYVKDLSKINFVIWTTTTWTLPGNVAICVGPNYKYSLVKNAMSSHEKYGEYYVLATELIGETMKAAKIEEYETIAEFDGKDLELIKTKHPFYDRESLVIIGDHVTLESGTGCVHTAPGHGVEDFEVCDKYPQLEILVPVDDNGCMNELAGEFQGLSCDDANRAIGKKMEQNGTMLAHNRIIHQYPHCWRCKEPVIFRATKQWFCSVEDFKEQTLKAISQVKWIPAWGEERIKGMVSDRSDWCISRQRLWGVPIPIVYCNACDEAVVSDQTIDAISKLFREKGSDAWYADDSTEFLGDLKCPSCGNDSFVKETDIMDVWFDSGVSHTAVLEQRPELRFPADLYLEGADQYRGWFQSSLLTSIAARGVSPYKSVCSHGWVVDGEGRKMSKSLGNGIAPDEIIKQYGADILRLWVASSDYHSDIRISKDILKQLTEIYRKIRNTARFMLGNTADFNPVDDNVEFEKLYELDQLILYRLDGLIDKCNKAYENFDFHIIFHNLHNFCVVDLSNFYLDIIKDRLYCENIDSFGRRAAQTAMYKILSAITKILAPILAFTAEEIWSLITHLPGENAESVLLNDMPVPSCPQISDSFKEKWERIYAIREDVQKALEEKRTSKIIGSALEAKVTLHCDDESYEFWNNLQDLLTTVFIVSKVEVVNDKSTGEFETSTKGITVNIQKADGEKCERCWNFNENVGENKEHPTLCGRCVDSVVNSL